MTVQEIVKVWLKEHGYDGLCTDGCRCGTDDLCPCCGDFQECVPAYKRIASEDDDIDDIEPGDTYYSAKKGKP
jgi:hypothetical protein